MYRFVCHSCNEREFFDDIDAAQTEFNDHAEEQHEVVLRRLKPSLRKYISELNDDRVRDEEIEYVAESEDGGSVDG